MLAEDEARRILVRPRGWFATAFHPSADLRGVDCSMLLGRVFDRHDVAHAHHDAVSRDQRRKGHLREHAAVLAHGGARLPRNRRRHRPASAAGRVRLQRLAPGVHQGDNGFGQRLRKRERAPHLEQGDQVEVNVALG
ncbi:hypothetical protein [Methylobacterium radiotolerans]|uniref:hypothetical protein n=1 Tax=Methylobacterium radiotolerans TaxID=31998 RepID=UPI00131A3DCE